MVWQRQTCFNEHADFLMYSIASMFSLLIHAAVRSRRVAAFFRLTCAVFILMAGRLQAAPYLLEGFNYAPGILGTNPPWAGATSLINVTNFGLTWSNLADFSPPANAAVVSPGSTSSSYTPLTTPATGGLVYFSTMINFSTKPGSYYIAGLTQSNNIPPTGAANDPLDLIDNTSGSGFKLGIRAMGGSTVYVSSSLLPLTTNTTYFIVLKYDFSDGSASLFLNPPLGVGEPDAPDATSVAAGIVPDLSYAYLRAGSSTAGTFAVGPLRVGSTWEDVTPFTGTVITNTAGGTNSAPVLGTNNITANGQMLAAFLDSLQVNNYWLDGYSVNWLTGATGGSSGYNKTQGTASHCSAFAGAVTDLLGVYLLRQPYASDINLANNQANWLATNTSGWFPIAAMTDAQHMVNTGLLVVASYQATSGSGHIAILRPSKWSDATINAFGPEECQSGTYNFADTNISTGFNQHPGAFPNNILYYGHVVNYPVSPVNPVLLPSGISNQTFAASFSSIVGRKYQVQWSSNLTSWNVLNTFTNSNNSTNCYTNSIVRDALAGGRFYRVLAK
jgi:hypothetical protein